MKLNHINLTVSAPVEAQAFFVKHLGLTAKGKGNENMAVLRDDNGMSVLLMSPSMGGDTTIGYHTHPPLPSSHQCIGTLFPVERQAPHARPVERGLLPLGVHLGSGCKFVG